MPIGRPMAMSDPNASSRMTTAATRPIELADAGLGLLEGEEQVAAQLDPQRRARPASRAERLEVLQVVRVQLLEHRVLDADAARPDRPATPRRSPPRSRPAASAPAGSLVPSTCGSAATAAWTSASAARASAESKNVAPLVARRHDHLGGEPGLVRPGGASAGRSACWESSAGRLERVLELLAEGARRADHDARTTTSQDPITAQGRRAAKRPSRYRSVRHRRGLLRRLVGAPRATGAGRSVTRPGGAHHRPEGRTSPGRSGERRLVLSADPPCARRSLRWRRGERRRPLAVGRAPSAGAARAGVAGLGARRACWCRRRCSRACCARTWSGGRSRSCSASALVVDAAVAAHAPARRGRRRVRRPSIVVDVAALFGARRDRSGCTPTRLRAAAPLLAVPLGIRPRGRDRAGDHPGRLRRRDRRRLHRRRRRGRRRACSCCSRRRSAPSVRYRVDRPGCASSIRSSSASASSWPASCTTRSPTTSRPSPSGPRPGGSSRPTDPEAAVRRARGHRGGGLAHARRDARRWSACCATATSPTLAPQRGRGRHRAARRAAPAHGPRVEVELVGRPRRPRAVGRGRDLPHRAGVDHQRACGTPATRPASTSASPARTTACG